MIDRRYSYTWLQRKSAMQSFTRLHRPLLALPLVLGCTHVRADTAVQQTSLPPVVVTATRTAQPAFDVPGVGRIVILEEPGGAGVGWMTPAD